MAEKDFIAQIAPIVQKYCKEYGYWVPSAIIGQACNESGFGRSSLASKYNNFFGMKTGSGWTGGSVRMKTQEYRNGVYVTVYDYFRVYTSFDAGIKGYFDFIQYPRYSNLKQATTPKQYLELIYADGYATSYSYVTDVLKVVEQHNLTQYDGNAAEPVKQPVVKTVSYAAQVTASALNVRTGPSANYPVLEVNKQKIILPKGICVAIDAECEEFAKLAGLDGWLAMNYLKR